MLNTEDIGKRVALTLNLYGIRDESFLKETGYVTVPYELIEKYEFLVKPEETLPRELTLVNNTTDLELSVMHMARNFGAKSVKVSGDLVEITDSYVKLKKLPLKRYRY